MMSSNDPYLKEEAFNSRSRPTRYSFLRAAFRISSLSDVVALFGVLGGCLFFYNRTYSSTFLSSFGLGVGVVPISPQDAMADGFGSAVINILYLWVPIATAFLLHLIWVIANRFFEPKAPTAAVDSPAPVTWWAKRRARVEADPTVQASLVFLFLVIAAPAVLLIAVGLIAVPAEMAAKRDASSLRSVVSGECVKCASYKLGATTYIGRPVASTADRLFVLARDGRVVPIQLDDLQAVGPAPHP